MSASQMVQEGTIPTYPITALGGNTDRTPHHVEVAEIPKTTAHYQLLFGRRHASEPRGYSLSALVSGVSVVFRPLLHGGACDRHFHNAVISI